VCPISIVLGLGIICGYHLTKLICENFHVWSVARVVVVVGGDSGAVRLVGLLLGMLVVLGS